MDVIPPEAIRQHYRGRRHIAYARCAYPGAAEDILLHQILRIGIFARQFETPCVGKVQLAGVGGYSPLFRDDLVDLLVRKRQQDDFDMVVMVDCGRLTRRGEGVGREIMATFARYNIEIVILSHVMEMVRSSHFPPGWFSPLAWAWD